MSLGLFLLCKITSGLPVHIRVCMYVSSLGKILNNISFPVSNLSGPIYIYRERDVRFQVTKQGD